MLQGVDSTAGPEIQETVWPVLSQLYYTLQSIAPRNFSHMYKCRNV